MLTRTGGDETETASQPADLAVVSCYFNPCNYKSRFNNLRQYIVGLEQQAVHLYLANLTLKDEIGVVSPSTAATVIEFQGRDVLWHKERLLNLLIRRLPPQYTKVAWIDADVIFPNFRWFRWTSELLDTYDLVQLYDKAFQRDNNGRTIGKREGLVAYISAGKPEPFRFDSSRTWPGLAWGAKRDLLATHGLFDVMVTGGADTYMSLAAYGRIKGEWHGDLLAPKLRKVWKDWAERFYGEIQGRVGFVPTAVIQLGHGTLENRRYVDRLRILTAHDFDPEADISPDENGVWRWATNKPFLHQAVYDYFESRKEDKSESVSL